MPSVPDDGLRFRVGLTAGAKILAAVAAVVGVGVVVGFAVADGATGVDAGVDVAVEADVGAKRGTADAIERKSVELTQSAEAPAATTSQRPSATILQRIRVSFLNVRLEYIPFIACFFFYQENTFLSHGQLKAFDEEYTQGPATGGLSRIAVL